ncbi:trypsin-like peptidase domain-containing protein [Streptomyces sp. NPDC049555]|uniref:trypsin-like peptidase domain-containing protein n=1 Tax=Streptomyces sp. NPDC049555 TaxID=3154930 RepID=UPI00342CB6DF
MSMGMDDGQARASAPTKRRHWWSRGPAAPAPHGAPEPAAPMPYGTPTAPTQAPYGAGVPAATVPGAPAPHGAPASAPAVEGAVPQGGSYGAGIPAQPQRPLHAPDPYSTPPYGGPGPWAPAPPVQRPTLPQLHVPAQPAPPATPPTVPSPAAPPLPATPASAAPAPGVPVQAADEAPPVPAAGPAPAATAAQGPVRLDKTAPAQPAAAPPATADVPSDEAPGAAPAGVPAGPPATDARPPAAPEGGPAAPPARGAWAYDPWAVSAAGGGGTRPPRGGSGSRGRLIAGAVGVALVAGVVGGGVGVYLERNGAFESGVVLPQASAGGEERAPGSIAGIAARALPGVVTIHVRGGGGQSTGTGFVLDKKGHILTNNHVVQAAASGSGSISVTFNGGQSAKATLVGRDGGYDLAVIKVSGIAGLSPLTLGNSDSVRVGDSVVAIGAPFDLAGTVTTGIISAKDRPITAGGHKKGDDEDGSGGSDVSYVNALQTDAAINPGNSGGPLMDAQARVIGINSAIRSAGDGNGDSGRSQGGSIGLGFAIPINQARRVAEELIRTGRATHPVIGVSVDMGYSGDGARVNTDSAGTPGVSPGSPAEKAGIRPGDVITKVDGVPVHSGQELIVKVRSHRPGDGLELTVEHDGARRTVRLVLGSASSG